MKRLIWILPLLLLFGSCATRQQKAVKHLNKALALDSNVLQNVIVPVIIDTTIIHQDTIIVDTTIVVPEKSETSTLSRNEINKLLDSTETLNGKVKLLETELIKINLIKSKDGLIDIQTIIKEIKVPYKDTIPYIDTIPFYKEIKAPSVAPVTKVEVKKGYFYWTGVIVNALLVLYILLTFINTRQNGALGYMTGGIISKIKNLIVNLWQRFKK